MAAKDLKKFSNEELEAELERRKKEATRLPEPLAEIDWNRIRAEAEGHVKRIVEEKDTDDEKQWIYEAVMESIYGPKFWEWILKAQR